MSKSVIQYPVATEKAIRLMQNENKLVFVVDPRARKDEIKKDLEELFSIKVVDVKTFITPKGKKRAIVKLHSDNLAMDVATKLGIL
ncbi:MAG: large subunit ribosomal protein [Candidatus Woesearchaeota archaeon]|nr:large subunit ribosomal protein [Candidatus Woesearchaeota archaeon]